MISLSCLEAATNHEDSIGNLFRDRACRMICTSGALVGYAERPIIDHFLMSSRVKRHQHVKCRWPASVAQAAAVLTATRVGGPTFRLGHDLGPVYGKWLHTCRC
jgi:hypothetical protein